MRGLAVLFIGVVVLCGCGHPVTIGLAVYFATKGGGHKGDRVSAPRILTDSLPVAVKGQQYSVVLYAEGGTEPYTWAVNGLPNGLSCDPDTGWITGVPSQEGVFSLSVTVTDSNSMQGQENLTLNVKVVAITTNALPDGAVNVGYSVDLEAVGGATPYTWSLSSGSLPPGLTLSQNGRISGTPTAEGRYDFSVQVQDNTGATDQKEFVIHIGSVAITTVSLPDGIVGENYGSVRIQAVGGSGSYVWSWSGDTPPGLSLSSNTGEITGTPSKRGDYGFTVTVTDGRDSASREFTVKIWEDLLITTDVLPDAQVGESYEFRLQADGGSGQYRWSWSGDIPPSLTLDQNGRIYGTPQSGEERSYTFTVQVDDLGNGDSATKQLSLMIRRFRITSAVLPDAFERFDYNAQLDATDGTPPYTWRRISGVLPHGVTLNSNGVITGIPDVGTGGDIYTFDVEATDAEGRTATATFSLTVYSTRYLEHFNNPRGIADSADTLSFGSFLRLSPVSTSDDPSITVSFLTSSFLPIGGDNWLAQTITTNGGRLFEVRIRIKQVDYSSNPQPIYADIWTLDTNGLPDQKIASSVLMIGSVPWPFRWRSFAFDCNLAAGAYMVMFHSPASFELRVGQDNPPYTGGDCYTSSDGGSTWNQQVDKDMDFVFRFANSFNSSGYASIYEVSPSMPGNWKWDRVCWSVNLPQSTQVTVQILYYDGNAGDWIPVPDTDLPGNSSGFDASAQSEVDISGLDVTVYSELRIRLSLSTSDITNTPSVDWVELSWQPVP